MPYDPLQGIISAQGSIIQHFVFMFVTLYILDVAEPVTSVKENLGLESVMIKRLRIDADGNAQPMEIETSSFYIECLTQAVEGQQRQIFYLEDNLRQAMIPLIFMHLACCISIAVAQYISA